MDLKLEGRIAIVNGASQGIGFCVARTLAEEGARVVTAQGNVRRAEDCFRTVDQTIGRFVVVDILVNNERTPPLGVFRTGLDDYAWSRAIDQNLMSVVRCIPAAAPPHEGAGRGQRRQHHRALRN